MHGRISFPLTLLLLAVALLVSACRPQAPVSQAATTAAATPVPTATPAPTATPTAMPTVAPVDTPATAPRTQLRRPMMTRSFRPGISLNITQVVNTNQTAPIAAASIR